MTKEPITIFHTSLADITRDTSATLLLQQIIFWFNDAKSQSPKAQSELIHPEWGLRKTAQETQDFFRWKRCEYDRAISVLESKNLISINAKGVPRTTHFLIHFEEIKRQLSVCGNPANWIAEILQTGLLKSNKQVRPHSANSNSNKELKDLKPLRDKKKEGGDFFKTWKDTPREFHPYFEYWINELSEPTGKDINGWLNTFKEFIQKGITPKKSIELFQHIQKTRPHLALSRPSSIKFAINKRTQQHGREDDKQKTRIEYRNGVAVEVAT